VEEIKKLSLEEISAKKSSCEQSIVSPKSEKINEKISIKKIKSSHNF